MGDNEVQLLEILEAREQRASRQQQLLAQFRRPLLCFMLNIPGPVKVCGRWELAFDRGVSQLLERLGREDIPILYRREYRPRTGYECYIVADCPAIQLKELCCALEDEEPLGRLYDMDVIAPDGGKLSRTEIGRPPRRCLLCGGEAHACARSRAHSVEELTGQISRIILQQLEGRP